MALSHLFPQPHQLTLLAGTVDLRNRAIHCTGADRAPLAQRASELFLRSVPATNVTNAPAYVITWTIDPAATLWPESANRHEAYQLELLTTGGTVIAASEAGIFAAFQTLRQLFRGELTELPTLRILDWPDFRYRGLYIESKWGPDRMTLDDWKTVIDYMAALKFNSLGVGVYGCWVVQYGDITTEFMMLPFPDHPTLQTPKTLRYYSPAQGDWQTLTYLPTMATEDFFGDLVAYAKANNITVRPHFNSPGHNTLIPRAYPETSALYEDGTPIGYGFCLSNPQSLELLFELYDSVIDRYLRPNGIDWFHIGLDEVTGYMGIDPARPFEVTDPWCRCPACRQKTHAQHLQEYVVKVGSHLKAQGITHITLWNDALDSLDALTPEFTQMLEEAGLRENVIVQWWRYGEPPLIPRAELNLRAWVTPMAGYWSNLFTQSYTSNIYPMLLYGQRAGAEGADAYAIFDPAFDRNYVCLAQYAWNQTAVEDLYAFQSRYAQALLGQRLDPALAAEAFAKYDLAFGSMAFTGALLGSLLYYWHTYPAARQRGFYPFNVLSDLLDERLRLRATFASAATNARMARDLLLQANQQAPDPLIDEMRAECDKLIGVWETYNLLLRAIAHYRSANSDETGSRLNQATSGVGQARERLISVLADLERVKQPYLLPQILRDLSMLLVYMDHLQAEFAALASAVANGTLQTVPEFPTLATNQINFDSFVSTVPKEDPA